VTPLAERIAVLRDEVLDTVEHGDRDPPGAEVFDTLLRALAVSESMSMPDVDLGLHDAVARRLAWGDREDVILGDADQVFDRLLPALERSLRDVDEQMAVVEAATQVMTSLARIVALAAVGRAGRDRAARLREEMSQRQLRAALDRQRGRLAQLEADQL
jgi:hypothetical protein